MLNTLVTRCRFQTLTVEYVHVKEGKEAVKTFLEQRGYELKGEITLETHMAYDMIFAKLP